ncbi:hypothetical protein DFH08DRAFT_937698 [Mycena albidolilacea]|uniref:Uncharacterized protein n=1 Tax=Mycena albidolilacea TaxID=1033008 RepID=A0AAD6ZY58_9AGAR|nr:hypothetical protein DFH08DRAFT_937698 [Mycena albidolilacea]
MGLARGMQVHNAGWGAGQSALGRRNSSGRRAGARRMKKSHAWAPGVNPKESTEPISGPSGGAHGTQSAVGAGRRVLGRHTTATGGGWARRGARWYAMRAGGGAVRTGSAQQGWVAHACAAHGGHTEEGIGALGYAWRRVRPSRIGGTSLGSEQRGGTANRRTAVLGVGSTWIPHGVGRCLGTRAARWATE